MMQGSNVGADPCVRPPVGYELGERDGEPFIRCLACNMTSFHPQDIAHRYCGFCHKFHDGVMHRFLEIRVCLVCGSACDPAAGKCPACGALEHTRTRLIVLTFKTPDGRMIVKVTNFGNHE